jgi:hypothetical protein
MAWKYLLKFYKVTDKVYRQTHRKENIILRWYLNSAHKKVSSTTEILNETLTSEGERQPRWLHIPTLRLGVN